MAMEKVPFRQTCASAEILAAFQYLKGATMKLERNFTRAWSARKRGNAFPVTEGRVRQDIGKEFLPLRVGRPWHSLARKMVMQGKEKTLSLVI